MKDIPEADRKSYHIRDLVGGKVMCQIGMNEFKIAPNHWEEGEEFSCPRVATSVTGGEFTGYVCCDGHYEDILKRKFPMLWRPVTTHAIERVLAEDQTRIEAFLTHVSGIRKKLGERSWRATCSIGSSATETPTVARALRGSSARIQPPSASNRLFQLRRILSSVWISQWLGLLVLNSYAKHSSIARHADPHSSSLVIV